MKREQSLISNTFILALGNFLPQVTALVTLPIYTGMLTTEEYGRYDLVNTVVYILGIVVLVQIQQAVFRYLIDVRGTEEQDVYITTTYFFELVPSVIASILFGLFYRNLPFPTPILLGLYLFLGLQYNVDGQVARGLENNKVYAIGSIIQAVLNMALVVVFVSGIKLGFMGLFISLDLAYAVACLYQFIACKQWKFIRLEAFSKDALGELLAYSWPMVPNTLSIWIVNTCDKFIIRLFLGVQYNGIFAVAQKIPNIFTMAYGTFNMAWQESASVSLNDSDHDSYYENVFAALFDFLAGSMLVLISATPILFMLLIKGDYSESYFQIPLLYVGVFLSCVSSFFGSIYIAQKETKAVGISSAIGAIINVVVNLSLVHFIGLYAASISTIVSYLILVAYRVVDIKRRKLAVINYNLKRISFCVILIVACCVLCYMQRRITNLINLTIGLIFFFLLNYKLLYAVLNAIIAKLHGKNK